MVGATGRYGVDRARIASPGDTAGQGERGQKEEKSQEHTRELPKRGPDPGKGRRARGTNRGMHKNGGNWRARDSGGPRTQKSFNPGYGGRRGNMNEYWP